MRLLTKMTWAIPNKTTANQLGHFVSSRNHTFQYNKSSLNVCENSPILQLTFHNENYTLKLNVNLVVNVWD